MNPGGAALLARLLPVILAWAALLLPLPWLGIAPNRLLPGVPVTAVQALGWWVMPAALLLAIGLPGRVPRWLGAASALAAAGVLLMATGAAAGERLTGLAPAARAGLGFGFWLGLLAALAAAWARASALRPGAKLALAALAALGAAALWGSGQLDPLSLAVEYRARAPSVRAAVGVHLLLAGVALLLAIGFAVPLAWAAFRKPRLGGLLGAGLAAVQVVPALALFAALIPILAALLAALPALRAAGLGAIGPLPAVLATAAYLALPLWRSLAGGLAAADPAAVAAAEAMGMTEGRIAREIRLPLALPVFAGGLRVALVQAIGLVTLGGLVGAGGLGALVFEGLAQFATDLMLLGALPIVALALLADGLAATAERRLAA